MMLEINILEKPKFYTQFRAVGSFLFCKDGLKSILTNANFTSPTKTIFT